MTIPAAADDGHAVVLGLGNRFRGDDAIGPNVLDRLASVIDRAPRVLASADTSDALAILNAWDGAALAIVIDAAVSGVRAGTVHRLTADVQPLPRELAGCSSHGLGLAEAMELGRVLGRMPDRLSVYAVEAGSLQAGNQLSPAVVAGINIVVREVVKELGPFLSGRRIHNA